MQKQVVWISLCVGVLATMLFLAGAVSAQSPAELPVGNARATVYAAQYAATATAQAAAYARAQATPAPLAQTNGDVWLVGLVAMCGGAIVGGLSVWVWSRRVTSRD